MKILQKINYYLILDNNDWGKIDLLRRVAVDVVHFLIDVVNFLMNFRVVTYSNKNLPRKKKFQVTIYQNCVVFKFKFFDFSFWWGDSYQDMDLDGE